MLILGPPRLFVSVGNSAFRQIVRGELHGDAIARKNTDAIAAQLAREMRKDGAVYIKLNAEQAAGKFFNYGSGDFYAIFFTHSPLLFGIGIHNPATISITYCSCWTFWRKVTIARVAGRTESVLPW